MWFQVQDTDTTCMPHTSRSPLPGRPAEGRDRRPPQGFCAVLPSALLLQWGPQFLGNQVCVGGSRGPKIPGWRDVPRCIRLPHWTPVCKWESSPKLQLQGQSQVLSPVDQQPKKDHPGSLGLRGVWNLQDPPDYASLKTSLLLGPLWLQLVLPPALDLHPSPVQQLYC